MQKYIFPGMWWVVGRGHKRGGNSKGQQYAATKQQIYYFFNLLPHLPGSMRVKAVYRLKFALETHDPALPALTLNYVMQLWRALSL